MDGVLGRVEVDRTPVTKPEIYSHGQYPVTKLQAGQTIRFRSRNYDNEVVMRIERVHRLDKMVIVAGQVVSDVAFGIGEWVELVTVQEESNG